MENFGKIRGKLIEKKIAVAGRQLVYILFHTGSADFFFEHR